MATPNEKRKAPASSAKTYPFGLRTIMELFDIGPGVAIAALGGAALVVFAAVFYFIHTAPPNTITFSTGPEGSNYQKNALKYAKILEKNGVKVNVLTSDGSLENLKRLADPKSPVDVAFVQAGLTTPDSEDLVSLGSVAYQPMLVFYRGKPLEVLSGLAGHKVSVGPDGSGTHMFALRMLEANGIKPGGPTTLLNLEAEDASRELEAGKIDAAFIMSESASTDILHKLMRSQDVHLYSFKQGSAYSRKVDYLNMLDLPEGGIDLGLDIPAHDVTLLGPMVELVAVTGLNPAISDLLLEAATQVHSKAGMFQHRGEFPAPIEHAIPISEDAKRFYTSGKSLLYRYLPYWLASLVSRIVVVFIPMLVVLIPALRSIPAFFRWRTQTKIRQRYRELLALEQEFLAAHDSDRQDILRHQFDLIESAVNNMRVRASFAEQFYGLRGHIDYVRQIMARRQTDEAVGH